MHPPTSRALCRAWLSFQPAIGRLLLAVLLPVLGLSLQAQQLPQERPVPGGIAIIELPASIPTAQPVFLKKPVWTMRKNGRRVAIVGIPLNQQPGMAELRIAGRRIGFQVQPHQYAESRIYLREKQYVEPPQETLQRIQRETRNIKAQFLVFTDNLPEALFSLPVAGAISSRFGLRRFFNDLPRKPHSGLDLAAPEGERIYAPAAGKVLLTAAYYFNGNTIFIDHGQGLITMYCHLHEIKTKAGQQLARGDVIGTVGTTGRVTGAHLHWAVSLGGNMVDPELFMRPEDQAAPP